MNTVGRHLFAELYGCDPRPLDDVDEIRQHMLTAAATIGAAVVGEAFHHFRPSGVSGVLVIAESHLSVHTWPDSAYAAVDIYTCGGLDPASGIRCLARSLGAHQYRQQEILRGLPEEIEQRRSEVAPEAQPITLLAEVREVPTQWPAAIRAARAEPPPRAALRDAE